MGVGGTALRGLLLPLDTFRTLHPLLTLIQPERQRDMVRSLIDTYAHTGWMPDARIAGANGMTQGGSNSDVLIADALAKGLTGIDYAKAYEAMVKNAEVDSPRPLHEGREVSEYKRLGYLSLKHARSASRTMEYAYNDFSIAQVAKALGRLDEYRKYLERSKNWMNLWDPQSRSIRPRYPDGRWLEPFSPTHGYPDEQYNFWEGPFYEGNGWQYSTYVPHDVRTLITLLGGEPAFVQWLDEFFDKGIYNQETSPISWRPTCIFMPDGLIAPPSACATCSPPNMAPDARGCPGTTMPAPCRPGMCGVP